MFKAITKALTLRFTPLARQVISSLQTGFIPGRYILDGCVILHEVLHELKTSHSEGIWLKLDFEKAYDRVQWPFLAEVMHRKNFPDRWIDWIRQAVEGGKVCVNMNGEVGPYLKSYKGLRQGDLTSSFSFGGGHRKGGHSSVRHSLSVQIAVHVRTALDCRGTNFRLL